jgi:oxygen-independent coproporphyrinogen-3 oxidase
MSATAGTPADDLRARTELRFDSLPPLSLYVHLPWCVRKCPYCDFNSYEMRGDLPDMAYVDALLRDFSAELPFVQERHIETVFIGGGTPSLFSGAAITRLLDGLRARAQFAADVEITLEANPGAVEAERFGQFREAGVNRLSIGVQSFRNAQLQALGRVHDCAEAVRAVELARAAGFENYNLDLMYALPLDDVAGALADLRHALELAPPHLSWYQLTLESNTAFERWPPALPGEEFVATLEEQGRALLASHGYGRYEVSAYAQPGRRCRHNLNYWQFGDYLGIGAGAHGKVTLRAEQQIERRAKARNPRTNVAQAGTTRAVAVERIAVAQQAAVEFLMNALRLPEGVSVDCFEQRTGQPIAALAEPLARAVSEGLLVEDRSALRPTADGLQVLNRLLALFC